ncbi:M14 family metallopeptidase [Sinomicrobium kalidii]|uniref:M14 family metallopeptidase n=1 Tax=Sinomicrobium kalidii TaxID=2900738 RepID=UPI001E40BF9D|nr:M14 family metallopeptidase [Sinomicrobium kalidii]UGU16901.1 M14 family metallopeptidase [Sinomicrobium kalidii]
MKKLFYLLPLFVMSGLNCTGQANPPKDSAYDPEMFDRAFEAFREKRIVKKTFKHEDIMPLIEHRKQGSVFSVKALGASVEGRSVYQLTCGKGETKVMLWSQMHGDESTATMALFDIFNFLEGENDGFDALRNHILEHTTLYFIPMLNPDGAERFRRRNSYDFDLNRDAVRAQAPESVILREAREREQPDFGFNLHDQNIYYNVSGTSTPATISVLAPAFNEAREVNEVRKRAMQVIVGMNRLLQQYIPGGVGKYDDTFEPRAFGDNFQKWGTSTILIESGGYPDDPEKQYIRKLNFAVILNALSEIASENYREYETEEYFRIPDNDSKLTDLLIRNVEIRRSDSKRYRTDISIKQGEGLPRIRDLGDLSVFYGYRELDASGYTWMPGKVYNKVYPSVRAIAPEEADSLLKKGYIAVRVNSLPEDDKTDLPLLLLPEKEKLHGDLFIGRPGYFFLAKEGKPVYAIVDGEIVKL